TMLMTKSNFRKLFCKFYLLLWFNGALNKFPFHIVESQIILYRCDQMIHYVMNCHKLIGGDVNKFTILPCGIDFCKVVTNVLDSIPMGMSDVSLELMSLESQIIYNLCMYFIEVNDGTRKTVTTKNSVDLIMGINIMHAMDKISVCLLGLYSRWIAVRRQSE
ncbi:hypothetical protein ACJX0J_033577, partial [Zea mays]